MVRQIIARNITTPTSLYVQRSKAAKHEDLKELTILVLRHRYPDGFFAPSLRSSRAHRHHHRALPAVRGPAKASKSLSSDLSQPSCSLTSGPPASLTAAHSLLPGSRSRETPSPLGMLAFSTRARPPSSRQSDPPPQGSRTQPGLSQADFPNNAAAVTLSAGDTSAGGNRRTKAGR